MILDRLTSIKNHLRPDPFARHEIVQWVMEHIEGGKSTPARVLDIGLGGAEDLAELRNATGSMKVEIFGVEYNPERVKSARSKGIEVFAINVENERIPLPDASLDAVMANHVIEHLKEVFFFFSEISRVLKPGGIAVIGFPNLGGWHNRLAILFGAEPPCMRMLGSHVRGITIPGFRRFIEFGGFFSIERVKGRAFYLLPSKLSQAAATALPGLGAAVHFVIKRTAKPGTYIDVLDMGVSGIEDTPYVRTAIETKALRRFDDARSMTP